MEKLFYLAQIFGNLHSASIALFIASLIFLGILLIVWGAASCDLDEDTVKISKKMIKPTLICVIVGALLNIFVPSKETFLFMMGGKVVDSAISNNPEIKELPENTLNLLNEYIKSITKDIESKTE